MARVPPTNGHSKRGRRRLAVPAADVRVGDVLWSDATNRALGVVAVWREMLRADGNLYADPDDPDVPRTSAVCMRVLDPLSGELQTIGGYAPTTRLQVLRAVPRMA